MVRVFIELSSLWGSGLGGLRLVMPLLVFRLRLYGRGKAKLNSARYCLVELRIIVQNCPRCEASNVVRFVEWPVVRHCFLA